MQLVAPLLKMSSIYFVIVVVHQKFSLWYEHLDAIGISCECPLQIGLRLVRILIVFFAKNLILCRYYVSRFGGFGTEGMSGSFMVHGCH